MHVEIADLDYDKIRAREEEASNKSREQINSSPFKSAKTMKANMSQTATDLPGVQHQSTLKRFGTLGGPPGQSIADTKFAG